MTAIDVVILTWNDPADLAHAVASAVDQEQVDARVVVVDNGSEIAARVDDPRVQLLTSATNLGVGGGRNLGIRAGTSPFVCVLDSDARLHPFALSRLLAPLLEDDTIGLSAPVFAGQAPEASAGRAPTLRRKVVRATNRTDVYERVPGQGTGAVWQVDFAIGACQLFRREAFERVGGIDSSARFGPEDVDFCLRLGQHGWRIVQVAGAACDHPPRRAFRRLSTMRGLQHGWALTRHLWRHRTAPARRS